MLNSLTNVCCKEFGALSSRLLTVVMVKRARFDEKPTLPVLSFVLINKPILTASYEIAYLIAKQGKPHTIGKILVKPAVLKMANIMLGIEAEVKLSQIHLSNDISGRIEDMTEDILDQVVADLISSPAKFSFQLDETTDVSNLSQLTVFVRYVKDDVIKDFLFSLFLQEHQHCHTDCFKNSEFNLILAYLADIFAALNHLDQKMQGGGQHHRSGGKPEDFSKKLPLWKRRTENNNTSNFLLLDNCVSQIEDVSRIGNISVPAQLKQAIATHLLDGLAKFFHGYFPTRESCPAWVPFTFSVETTDVNDEYLNEIIEIQESQVQQQLFRTTALLTFWYQQMVTYPVIAKKALEISISFVMTYVCKQSFLRMQDIKTKKRNRLRCENDMRVVLVKVKPRISEPVSERQQ
ncbi:hypothetical protein FHG87_001433 [Trinorchestia longiramus]|nr:hypothetical protein FHG87_001433 [Trinorchestia longiramus]